mmetsp:Transcript_41736/g.110246  ORF Transcript_41736/g.110246 Transcript_41736/m.110246 type:complete len:431 (+) Transcript_41736:139-1431(+)
MPKQKGGKSTGALRHNPLAEDIIEEEDKRGLRKDPRQKIRRKPGDEEDEERSNVIPASMTRKVLEISQKQKAEEDAAMLAFLEDGQSVGTAGDMDDMDEEPLDVDVDEDGFVMMGGASEEDERALNMFLGTGGGKGGVNLADVILQKIAEKESGGAKEEMVQAGGGAGLSEKVMQVYSEIGKWLKNYKSGKLPKAFKVIPSLTNWEEVLSLTNPLNWSPAAMYEAVNIFASNLNPRMAQRFFNLVLLPAIRQNIAEHGKLNFHYYRSLKKSLFKPAAFFKGIVLPMAQEQCTLREATIVSAVLTKVSIPAMHVAATLMRLATMTPWFGTTAIFMASLLNKKYALPVTVLGAMSAHFCAFASEQEILPLVWHRCLLIFVQRYKWDLGEDQRKKLRELLKIHFHDGVGPEIRRELLAPKPGEAPPAGGMEVG